MRGASRALGALLLLCAAGSAARAASTRSLNEEGNRAYRRAEFEQALRAYTEAQVRAPGSPVIEYNIGNVFYRQQEYGRAAGAYLKALDKARGALGRDAAYNLGNARFQEGDYAGAVAAYRGALQIDPGDRDAKRNLEIALSKLQPPPPGGGGPRKQDRKEESKRDPGASPAGSPQPEQPRQDRPPPGSGGLDRQEAERLLEALAQEERENLERDRRRARPVQGAPGGKDW